MCRTCGCSDAEHPTITNVPPETPRGAQQDPTDAHRKGASHGVPHTPHQPTDHSPHSKTIRLEEAVLSKNDQIAARNRIWLVDRHIMAVNLLSSPGSGKTTLLEKTINSLQPHTPFSVIEGDQATLHDAQRLHRTGCHVVQINTGAGCHLDADMVWQALASLQPPERSILMIENVGNLVCPALFDLGEQARVVLLSTTEGEDKPLKYPHIFHSAHLVVLNKTDLLPHLSFDMELCLQYLRTVNPSVPVLKISASTGEGMDDWYDWLLTQYRTSRTDVKGFVC